jgi:signal transduction histidine kinase
MSDMQGETGLKFFGAVTASISHEMKNRMAIINEQAGLLEDLVRMAGQGRELDHARLLRLADSVKSQISMADDIIKNMNRFAHLPDVFWQTSDLCDLVSLAARLSKRMADTKGVRLETRVPETAVKVTTSPFLLLNLIWLCLERVVGFSPKERVVLLGCEKTPEGASLWVSADAVAEGPMETFLFEETKKLADNLKADFILNPEAKRLTFTLPAHAGPVMP